MTLNQEELIEYLGISKSSLKTNFPKLCQKQLEKGRLIRKRGKGDSAIYEIETVVPQTVDKSEFSSRPTIKAEDLEGEFWKTIPQEPLFEVSNLGRVRNKQTKNLHQGTDKGNNGYVVVSILNKHYRVHRLVMEAFEPIENSDILSVDHINGIRSDNRLENLRWMNLDENINAMMSNRKDLNIELTRIIQKFGYEKTLELLKTL